MRPDRQPRPARSKEETADRALVVLVALGALAVIVVVGVLVVLGAS